MRLNAYSGDGHLRLHQAAAYLVLNAFDNARPNASVDAGLENARFACPPPLNELRRMAETPRPSRAPCSLLWGPLPWTPPEEPPGASPRLGLRPGFGRGPEQIFTSPRPRL